MLQILLQASPNAQYYNLIFIAAIILVFYFFMIRPQQKRQKEQKTFLDNLKVGGSVVTLGGIHGKIVSIEGSTVVLEVDKGVKLRFEKSAVSFEQSKTLAE
jgi:preprotein translocase subunit YajC